MTSIRRFTMLAVAMIAVTLVLSWGAGVPYVFSLAGFAGWALVRHLVRADGELARDWRRAEEDTPLPMGALGVKALVFLGLCWACAAWPWARALGARH